MTSEQEHQWQAIGNQYFRKIAYQLTVVRKYVQDIQEGDERHLAKLGRITRQIAGTASIFGYAEIAGYAGRLALAVESRRSCNMPIEPPGLSRLLTDLESAVEATGPVR